MEICNFVEGSALLRPKPENWNFCFFFSGAWGYKPKVSKSQVQNHIALEYNTKEIFFFQYNRLAADLADEFGGDVELVSTTWWIYRTK